jgi:hypothetical protein
MFRLFAASSLCVALSSGFAMADQEGGYLLTLPVGYGDARHAAICQRAVDQPDSTCRAVTLTDPVSGAAVILTELMSIGSLDQLAQRFQGDFVPWPWSSLSNPERLVENDFDATPILPVAVNPCAVALCAEGTECSWDPRQPWAGATCTPLSGASEATPLYPGWSAGLQTGQITRLQTLDARRQPASPDAGSATAPPTSARDIQLCGRLPPGRMCMGNYIQDSNGTIWQIP